MNGYRLIEAVKKANNWTSDYRVSEELNIERTKISQWKRGRNNPDLETGLRLAAAANLSADEALKLMQSGKANVSLLIVTALLANPITARCLHALHCILC